MAHPSDRRFPAEWERQSGVQLTWPHPATDWAAHLDVVEPCFVSIAREIARREKLIVAAADPGHVARVLEADGTDLTRVFIYEVLSNDSWARDHAGITVIDKGSPAVLDFTFNGWGGKYAWETDDLITRRLQSLGAFGETPVSHIDFILEGGSIETDGRGTLLTTSSCLLSPRRNRTLDRTSIEVALSRFLGINRTLWLDHGYQAGDDTDAHIDILARFCDERTIAYVSCDDPADEHYDALQAMQAELRTFLSVDGTPYRLVPLPMPAPAFDANGERLPASYANFLIINESVLVPVYADKQDAHVLETLGRCFPGREIVGIDCRPLILQHGSLHCVTMQFPEGVLP